MKFWLCISALVGCLAVMASPPGAGAQTPVSSKRANELTLAGLRPGRSVLAEADARYKTKHRVSGPSAEVPEWVDLCNRRLLRLEVEGKGVIQAVTVSSLGLEDIPGDCSKKAYFAGVKELWKTGRGLKLGDPRDRIIELYGEPNSSGPSTKHDRELELLFYAFDWAGSDVPQVLEVSCDRATGRVVEITLAYPSL